MEHNLTKPANNQDLISPATGLTAIQEKGAILLASGIRITEVAKELGLSRGTLYRWQSQIAFQCFYNLMKQDVKNYLEGSVLELHKQALDGIRAGLSSQNESIKLKASMWVVDKISRMEIGQTDVRRALQAECAMTAPWEDSRYKQALEDAGLEE